MDITVWDKDAGKKDDFMGRYGALHKSARAVFSLMHNILKIHMTFIPTPMTVV